MKTIIPGCMALNLAALGMLCSAFLAPSAPAQESQDSFAPVRRLVAQTYDSGFAEGHDTYNGMGCASDGKIYYVLSSEKLDIGAKMYSFDPKSKKIAQVGDLTEACGEAGKKSVVQGKSHVNFVEANGKLYFATHAGYYSIIDGMEKMGIPPAGWTAYPGGHLLAYELASGKFEDFGIPVPHEGILTMSMDKQRGRIFGISWPTGQFFRYDLAKKETRNFGKVSALGESGKGAEYRTLCRSIAVTPADGSAWFTVSEGDIFRWDPAQDKIAKVEGEDLRKDYFGLYDPTSPGHMGYNWRQTFCRPADGMIYGVHGNSGYLFRFDPARTRVEVLERLTSLASKASGMFDQFSYGYLGFTLGHDGRTIYYLTGGPIYENGRRLAGKSTTAMGEAKGLEDLHLITYDIPARKYTDQGAIFYQDGQRPLYVNSIAVAPDGTVCFLARITKDGRTRADLVTVKP